MLMQMGIKRVTLIIMLSMLMILVACGRNINSHDESCYEPAYIEYNDAPTYEYISLEQEPPEYVAIEERTPEPLAQLHPSLSWRLEPAFSAIWVRPFSDNLAVVHGYDGSVGVIDINGNFVVPLDRTFQNINCFYNGHAVASIPYNQLWREGVIDREGNVVIPFEFFTLTPIAGGRGFIGSKILDEDNWLTVEGAIDIYGNILIPFEFSGVRGFGVRYISEGMFSVVQGYKYGHVRWGGDVEAIEFIYSVYLCDNWLAAPFHNFSEGLAVVGKQIGGNPRNRIYGYVDRYGEVVIPFQYSWASSFSQGLAFVAKEVGQDYYGYAIFESSLIDRQGNTVVTFESPMWVESFSDDGLAIVSTPYGIGFINKSGKIVVEPPPSEHLRPFSYGLAAFVLEGGDSWFGNYGLGGFMNRQGEVVIPAVFDLILEPAHNVPAIISQFEYGLAIVARPHYERRLFGLIDTQGNIVVPIEFDYIGSFHNGLARVSVGQQYPYDDMRMGFVNTDGEFVVPLVLEDATAFSGGVAAVKQNGLWGIILLN